MNRILLPCVLLLSACSAEVFVETEPLDPITVPVTSLLQPVYAEVAIDIPPAAQGDIILRVISADLTVVNPTQALTLETGARLSLEGQATPEMPPLFYTNNNLPAYFNKAALLLPTRDFAPQSRTPVVIDNPVLVEAAVKKRIWIIVNNTVKRLSIGTDTLPVNIVLENIVFRAQVTKPFPGIGGGMEVGGL